MTITLAKNIRGMRKTRGLTQEQLAEAMGVSVAAVSKWETGASAPELTVLVELAAFFETSVDVLLGYGWETGNMGRTVERLRMLRREKRYDEGMPEAEKALIKYPNSFDVVLASAKLLSVAGIERDDRRAMRRAIELYRRACELIDQNTDEHVSVATLQIKIAEMELGMGEYESAVQRLKANNPGGINDDLIGYTCATDLRRPDEAKPYLGSAFLRSVFDLFRIVIAQVNVFVNENRQDEALSMLRWLIGLYKGLMKPGSAMLDKYVSMLLVCSASISVSLHDYDAARDSLVQAREMALRFDATPDYRAVTLRYYCGEADAISYDSLGDSALESLNNFVRDDNNPELMHMWKELNVK